MPLRSLHIIAEIFYQIGIMLCSPWFYALVLAFGLITPWHRRYFYWLSLGSIINALININLKWYFKVPLSFTTKTYAFPSGHMQAFCFLFGFLAYFRIFNFQYFTLPLLLWIASSLVHFGYHQPIDIIGACLCTSIFILFYAKFYSELSFTLGFFWLNVCIYIIQKGLDTYLLISTLIFCGLFLLKYKFRNLA